MHVADPGLRVEGNSVRTTAPFEGGCPDNTHSPPANSRIGIAWEIHQGAVLQFCDYSGRGMDLRFDRCARSTMRMGAPSKP